MAIRCRGFFMIRLKMYLSQMQKAPLLLQVKIHCFSKAVHQQLYRAAGKKSNAWNRETSADKSDDRIKEETEKIGMSQFNREKNSGQFFHRTNSLQEHQLHLPEFR